MCHCTASYTQAHKTQHWMFTLSSTIAGGSEDALIDFKSMGLNCVFSVILFLALLVNGNHLHQWFWTPRSFTSKTETKTNNIAWFSVCVCVWVFVCVCVCEWVRVCVRACVRAWVCIYVSRQIDMGRSVFVCIWKIYCLTDLHWQFFFGSHNNLFPCVLHACAFGLFQRSIHADDTGSHDEVRRPWSR